MGREEDFQLTVAEALKKVKLTAVQPRVLGHIASYDLSHGRWVVSDSSEMLHGAQGAQGAIRFKVVTSLCPSEGQNGNKEYTQLSCVELPVYVTWVIRG